MQQQNETKNAPRHHDSPRNAPFDQIPFLFSHISFKLLSVFQHLVQAPFCLPTSPSPSFKLLRASCMRSLSVFPHLLQAPSSFLYGKPFLFSHIPFQAPSISPLYEKPFFCFPTSPSSSGCELPV